jgi:nicotinate phosphoribosyltransferase
LGTALLTDHYELTMVQAALRSGVADDGAVFEAFTRRLPPGRRYGVFAGLGRLLDGIEQFRFSDDELSFLSTKLDDETCSWLADYRFRGSVDAYREGELFFPHSPVLTVESTFADAVVLETLVLSVLNHDSAVASASARMVDAAGGRIVMEMGGRRTHEDAAVASARAAYVAGFDYTSNLEAGRRYGIPTTGTAAHAFVLAHASEADAFAAQVAALGPRTTLLVDTFDIEQGVRNAIAAAGPELGGVRIDSGLLPGEARRARRMLDEAGCTSTRIVVSGDLDEFSIAELRDCPVDVFGVGTSVVTGSGHPTAGFVYKLVVASGRPVAKRSLSKQTIGGRKHAARVVDEHGRVVEERLTLAPVQVGRALQERVMHGGDVVQRRSLDEARSHCAAVRGELRPEDRLTAPGEPVVVATMADG